MKEAKNKRLFLTSIPIYLHLNGREGHSMPQLVATNGEYQEIDVKPITKPVYVSLQEEGKTEPRKSLTGGEYRQVKSI
ncbi:MAG: hypothetical protein ABSC87_04015 [Halobacteriota archaeon]|jgi:hypothetical protein